MVFIGSQKAYTELKDTGADVNLTAIPTSMIPPFSLTQPFVHVRCALLAYKTAIICFDAIRNENVE